MGLEKAAKGLRQKADVKRGFCSVQWLSPPYWGLGQISGCWNRSPEGWVWSTSVPLKCVFFCFPAQSPLAPEKSSAGARGNGVGTEQGSGHRVWYGSLATFQQSGLPVMCCLCYQPQWLPSPCSDTLSVWVTVTSYSWALSSFLTAFALVGSFSVRQMAVERLLDSGWGTHQIGHREWVNDLCGFSSTFPARVWEQASIQVLITKKVKASHSTLEPPISQGGASICQTPGVGHPICCSNYSLSSECLCLYSLPFPLNLLPEAQVLIWSFLFPSYPILHVSFFRTTLIVQESFC